MKKLKSFKKEDYRYSIEEMFYFKKIDSYNNLFFNEDIFEKICNERKFKIIDENYDFLVHCITDKINWIKEKVYYEEAGLGGYLLYLGIDNSNNYYFLSIYTSEDVNKDGKYMDSFLNAEAKCQQENTFEYMDDLRKKIKRKILQFDSLAEFKEYFKEEFCLSSNKKKCLEFINKL